MNIWYVYCFYEISEYFIFCLKFLLFSALNWCLAIKRGQVSVKIKISCAVVALPWTIYIYFVSILLIKHDEKINIHNNKMWKFS